VGDDGSAWCWGTGTDGQLGDGRGRSSATPTRVALSGVAQVVAAGLHTCARTTAGAVYCFGFNDYGQLGDGSTTSRTRPVQVRGLLNAVELASASATLCSRDDEGIAYCRTYGLDHTCARLADGTVWCWGLGARGELGDGAFHPAGSAVPVQVMGVSGATALLAGGAHSCARTDAAGWLCWGDNAYGQLLDGEPAVRAAPYAPSLE
jgi:alpha-tubulin suppressor-like RCC1 family protein